MNVTLLGEKKTFLVIRAQTSSSTQSVTWNQFSLVFDHQERWLLYFTEYFTINLWLKVHVKLVAFPLFLHPIIRAGYSFVCPLVLAAAGTFSRLLSSCSFSAASVHPSSTWRPIIVRWSEGMEKQKAEYSNLTSEVQKFRSPDSVQWDYLPEVFQSYLRSRDAHGFHPYFVFPFSY